jgi:hypothetical protein
MEIKGTIVVKKSDNKAFKFSDEQWYNVNEDIIPVLTKMNKGDEVVVTYEKKGVSRYVSSLVSATAKAPAAVQNSGEKFECIVCHTPLKDGKYKKCYNCNKSGAKPQPSTESSPSEFKCEDCGAPLKDGKYKKCYPCGKKSKGNKTRSFDSPEKTAQIQRGNALNAAASVASSQQFSDPNVARQFTIILAEGFLEWLRGE